MRHFWKLISLAGVAGLSLMVWAAPAAAQRYSGYVEQRLDRQEDRIRQGVHTGALTPQEARKLSQEQERLAREVARLRADGRLTPQERYRLEHRMDQANRHIYREMHDRQATFPRYAHPTGHSQDYRWQDRRSGSGRYYHHQPHPRVQMRPSHREPSRPFWPNQPQPRLARQYW